MVDFNAAQINDAVEILVREARPEKVILFGSYARGDFHEGSDMDFLVIMDRSVNRGKEMVRLRRALSPMRIPVDIIVKSRTYVKDWGDVPASFLFNALREGRVVYEKQS